MWFDEKIYQGRLSQKFDIILTAHSAVLYDEMFAKLSNYDRTGSIR
jgi:hypothetical protein